MMKKFMALTLALILAFGFSGSVYAADGPIIDQSNVFYADGGYIILYTQPLGQEFLPEMPLLAGVEIKIMFHNINNLPEDITLNIREATINGTVIASKTITLSEFYMDWLYFEFLSPVQVTPGSVYVIEVQSTDNASFIITTINSYEAGSMIMEEMIHTDKDINFRTYALHLPPPTNNVSPMAAPEIAGIILNAEGVNPSQSAGKGKNKVNLNLISETARQMGPQTLFNGIEKSILDENGIEVCNPAYWNAVLAFLNSKGFAFTYSLVNYITDMQ